MRIISNFHDFYDSAKIYDNEHNDVLVRRTEQHDFPKHELGYPLLPDGLFVLGIGGALFFALRY